MFSVAPVAQDCGGTTYTTLAVEVVNPMRAYDRWWASLIDHPPQMENEDLGTEFLDFPENPFHTA